MKYFKFLIIVLTLYMRIWRNVGELYEEGDLKLHVGGHLKNPTLVFDEVALKNCCFKWLGSLILFFFCLDLSFALRNDDELKNKYF